MKVLVNQTPRLFTLICMGRWPHCRGAQYAEQMVMSISVQRVSRRNVTCTSAVEDPLRTFIPSTTSDSSPPNKLCLRIANVNVDPPKGMAIDPGCCRREVLFVQLVDIVNRDEGIDADAHGMQTLLEEIWVSRLTCHQDPHSDCK